MIAADAVALCLLVALGLVHVGGWMVHLTTQRERSVGGPMVMVGSAIGLIALGVWWSTTALAAATLAVPC